MSKPPVVDVDMSAFWQDPYPVLANMRSHSPIAFVPQTGSVWLTLRDDIVTSEKNVDVFSSSQPDGLMTQLMGHNLMRKDGVEHLRERQAMFPSVSPKTVREQWVSQFEQEAHRLLDALEPKGHADLFFDYAMPLSGHALKVITGLTQVGADDLDAWSQAMIAGIANYTGEDEPRRRCDLATVAIDAAIDQRIDALTVAPDSSMLSVLMKAGMAMPSVRANIKLAISGGQNEPRDAIAGATWALLKHPGQLAAVRAGDVSWNQVFDEYVRWIAPVGMSPRRVASQHDIRDISLPAGQMVFLMFSSANRDESHFEQSDQFDIHRDARGHIGFGAGPHFCAGAAASRALVAQVGLPVLFDRLRHLRLRDEDPVKLGGWAFRGPLNLPVRWD
ncbi:MAG: cytochrome P450 [Burkholderiaceae bacterium]